jgi:glucose/arabinose dehydrogenase
MSKQQRLIVVTILTCLAIVLAWGIGRPSEATLAAPAALTWPALQLNLVASGLSSPVSMSAPDDQSGRLFILEQTGKVRIMKDRVLLSTPFLDVSTLITCCGERGLLGLAFPPGFAAKGHFYIYYTNTNGDILIARYNVSANPDLADPASGVTVMTIPHPDFANHNGGQLAFGADGYLYAGIGDGGSGGDPNNHGQSLNTLLGKLLRIDVEGAGCVQNPPKTLNYCIPASNPLTATAGARAEIWAYGLRNPWRFGFDRLTHDLYIGDVGQNAEEEIDFQPAASPGGENYGWRILEGNLCYNASSCVTPPGYVAPVAVYDHGSNNVNGCSVTGGYVYRGPDIYLNLNGVYLYADFCKGKIYGLQNNGGWQSQLLLSPGFNISTFGQDGSGFLYVAHYSGGKIYQIHAAINQAAFPERVYMPFLSK